MCSSTLGRGAASAYLSRMRVIRVEPDAPDRKALRDAAQAIRRGALVAFPTETVYGLGANALDAAAVAAIYAAKGRPAVNPVIVHVSGVDMARALAGEWPPLADRLAAEFWPGPLTMVVRRGPDIPDVVTGGGDTVGLRMPAHPVALALIELSGLPLAAPSANRSSQVSPTTAEHVVRGLGNRMAYLVDAGPTSVGIESTVVDVTGPAPRLLRPGMISALNIARAAGVPVVEAAPGQPAVPRSPGVLGKHYAPGGRVLLFESGQGEGAVLDARGAMERGVRVGTIVFAPLALRGVHQHIMPRNPGEYARQLYATLHRLDDAGCELIVVERPPATPEWQGVLDRLHRAALPGADNAG